MSLSSGEDGGGWLFGAGPEDVEAQSFVPGEILIGFEGDVATAYHGRGAVAALDSAQSAVQGLGLHNPKVLMDVPPAGGRGARLATKWQLAPGDDVAEIACQLAGRPGVAYAEPDYVWSADAIPNDLRFAELWGMHNTGQTGGTADADIDAPEAWNIATGSQSIVAAVIDSGVDYNHPDLAANTWTNPGEAAGDGIDNDGNGYVDDVHGWDFVNGDSDPIDDNGHGTHVSGTIAAVGDNAAGVAGVNWSGQVMALKFLNSGGSGPTSAAVSAVEYATMMRSRYGVNVVLTSNSWGGGAYSQALYDAIAASGQAGMLFIAAAGNNNVDNDASPHYPSSYDLENIIAVAATDAADAKASFSCFGPASVDLAAPGVDILSTLPGADYGTNSGTSMATPHVSGVAALAWSLAPDASPATIKQAILDGADRIDSMAGMTVSGGRLNAYGTLRHVGMAVAGSSPASDGVITQQPLQFAIDFSFPVLASSLAKEDLTVNGKPADKDVVLSGDRLRATFYFDQSPVTAEGVQTMAMAAAAVQTDSVIPASADLAAWHAPFRYDGLRMTPQADPADGSTLALPWNTLTVSLNEDCDPGSVGTGDLVLSQGSVETAALIGPGNIQYTIAGLDEGELAIVLPAGAYSDAAGNPSLPMETRVYLDFGTFAYPGQFIPVEPAGSLVYQSQIEGAIGQIGNTTGADIDEFEIALDAGQTMTVIAEWIPLSAFNGHGYVLSGARNNWQAAQAEAAGLGGYLVSVNSQAEQEFLVDTFLSGTTAKSIYWLGFNDALVEGQWQWASGEPVSYTNWDPGQPDDAGGEDYAAINCHYAREGTSPPGTWNDVPLAGLNDGPYQGIIEMPYYIPEEPLLPAIAIYDPSGQPIGASSGSASGEEVILQSIAARDAGLYTIAAGSATGAEGRYRLRVLLNGAVEEEEHGGGMNDSPDYAQSLESSFISLAGGTADRAAVVGQTRNPEPAPGPVRTYAQTTPVAIPDAGTVISTVTIDDSYLVDDLNVHLDISHTYDTDLDVFLVAPDGTRVELFTDVGGSANHFTGTILDDEATISIAAGAAPFTGVFRPEGRLSDMDFHNVQGTWTLEITDDTKRDRGTLNRWSLEISELVDAPDFYSFQLDAGQIAALVLNAPDASLVDLELWGPNGAGGTSQFAAGESGMANADHAIEDFAAPRAGTYYARVNGAGRGWDYTLSVLRDTAFELESNENSASAFPLDAAANVLGAIDKRVNAAGGVIESFEDQNLEEYQGVSSGVSVAAAAAHDGGYGLSIDADWIRCMDDQVEVARGDLISAWVRFPAAADGRAYFGFGSTAASTLALTLGPNTGQLLLHRVAGSYQVLASVPQTWAADHWYRVEVEWQNDGDLVGRLYDSDGITLLNKVAAHDDSIASGGIAFRGFSGAKHFDTIQVGTPSPDFYQLSAVAGDRIDLATATPLGGPGLPINELDPLLRLYNASGKLVAADDNSADGRNAALSYIIPPGAVGDYFVEVTASGVTAEPTFGEYELAWSKTAVVDPILFVSDAVAIEGDSGAATATFTVTLMNPPAEGGVSVTYSTQDGTADGIDYDAVSDTTVALSAGVPSIQVPVAVHGDAEEEYDESFFLAIETTAAGVIVANGGLGTATILNDDAAASIADVRIEEGDSGSVDAVFTIALSRACATPVTIGYVTADGTATVADSDYLAAEGTVVIPAGQLAGSLTIQVIGDVELEPEETFFVNLNNPKGKPGLMIADGEAICTIHGQEAELPLPAPSGALSWWTGDGNAQDFIGPNHGTLTNGAKYAAGYVGSAFTFDGIDDMFQAPADGLPTGNQDRTLELWVKFDSLPSRHIAGYGNFGVTNQCYGLFVDAGHENRIGFSQWGSAIWGPVLSTGRWYHVAVTNVGNTEILYLDGVAVATGSLTINTPPGGQVFIGRHPFEDGPTDGLIDEISIYDRALSADEILSIYRAGAAGKVKGPGITVHPISGLVTTEAGGGDAFGVVLNTQPNADVTIGITSSDSTEAIPSVASLVFTPDNWSVPQTVNVVGVDDSSVDGRVAYTILLAPGASMDSAYHGLDPADVSGTNLDNEGLTYPSADVPKAIPDRGKVTSTLTIPGPLTIGDVNVQLSISHTRDEDLDVFLIAPNGTRVELFTDVGATGDHFLGTILDDQADQSVTTGAAPFTGAFRPEGSLSVLRDTSAAGIWTLEITDDARKETGTLTAWSLIITPWSGASAQLAPSAADAAVQATDRVLASHDLELAAWFEAFNAAHARRKRMPAASFDAVFALGFDAMTVPRP